AVPPPRFHTVRYAGVLASASEPRSPILPEPPEERPRPAGPGRMRGAPAAPSTPPFRPWAELMMRTFSVDVLCCPRCSGRIRLVALMTVPKRFDDTCAHSANRPRRRHEVRLAGRRTASRALRRRAGDVD